MSPKRRTPCPFLEVVKWFSWQIACLLTSRFLKCPIFSHSLPINRGYGLLTPGRVEASSPCMYRLRTSRLLFLFIGSSPPSLEFCFKEGNCYYCSPRAKQKEQTEREREMPSQLRTTGKRKNVCITHQVTWQHNWCLWKMYPLPLSSGLRRPSSAWQ